MFLAASMVLLAASVAGKLAGIHLVRENPQMGAGRGLHHRMAAANKALIMIIFVNILLDKGLITRGAFTALLLMAVASTMLTIPIVYP